MPDTNVKVRITAETKDLNKRLKEAQKSLDNLATKGMSKAKKEARALRKEVKALSQSQRRLAKRSAELAKRTAESRKALKQFALVAGATALAVGVKTVKAFAKFEKGMAEVGTLSKFTGKQMRGMSRETQKMGITFGQSLAVMTKARYDIVSAGFADITEQTTLLTDANKLAIAGATDVGTATDLLTSALNAYQLSAKDAEMVSDTFFATVRVGKTTIPELAASLGDLLPISKTAGVSLVEVGGIMATLTASGIKTSKATTALSSAIFALSSPAKEAGKAMEEAGIRTTDAKGAMLPMVDVLQQFEGMSLKEVKKFVPDKEAAKAILAAANNMDKLRKNVEKVAKAGGITAKKYKEMAGTTQVAIDQVGARVEVLQTVFGNFITDTQSGPNALGLVNVILDDWIHLLRLDEKGVSNLRGEFAMFISDLKKAPLDEMLDLSIWATTGIGALGMMNTAFADTIQGLGDVNKAMASKLADFNDEQMQAAIISARVAGEEITSENKKVQQRIDTINKEMSRDAISTFKQSTQGMSNLFGGMMDGMKSDAKDAAPRISSPIGSAFSKTLGGMKSGFSTWFNRIQKKSFTIRGTLIATLSAIFGGGRKPSGEAKGGRIGYQAGGQAGIAPSDTVPAMLTPGEFVINRESTERFLPLLTQINKGFIHGGPVGFAKGGKAKLTKAEPGFEVDPAAMIQASFFEQDLTPIQQGMQDMWRSAWNIEYAGFVEGISEGFKGAEISVGEMILPDDQLSEMAAKLNEVDATFGSFWKGVGAEAKKGAVNLTAGGFGLVAVEMGKMIVGTKRSGGDFKKAMKGLLAGAAAEFGQLLILKGAGTIAMSIWPPIPQGLAAGAAQITAGMALKAYGSSAAGGGGGGGGAAAGGGGGGGFEDFGGGMPTGPEAPAPGRGGPIINITIEGPVLDLQELIENHIAPATAEFVGLGGLDDAEFGLVTTKD